MDNEKEIEISLKDIFGVIKRSLWIVIVTAIVFGIAAFGYSKLFIQKTYISTMKLYVDTHYTTGMSSYNDLSSHNYAKDLVDTYIEMLDTNSFYEKIATNLSNKYTAAQLSNMMIYDNSTETETFTLSVVANSPTEAKIIADSVAAVAPEVISHLKDNATLKIVDNPTIPSAPASPNVSKNTLIALIIGIVLALAYIFIKEFFDAKIKYDPDITEYDDIPILAAIPDFKGPGMNLNMLTAMAKSENTDEEGK